MPNVNITTESDADFARGFVYQTSGSGAPINLTGDTFRMGVRRKATDATEYLLLTTENGGIVVTDAANGKFTINITRAQLLLLPAGTYVHSLIRIHSGRFMRVWSGTLTHSAGPSR